MKHFVRDQTTRRMETLANELESTGEQPDPSAHVHRIRVATRRLQQCLRLFGGYLNKGKITKLQRRLRKLVKLAGSVRNCDITIELLITAGIRSPSLTKKIADQREQLETVLAKHVDRMRRRSIATQNLRVSRRKKGTWDLRQTPSENARRVLPDIVATWFSEGDATLEGGREALHGFRLSGKRLRYTLELFAMLYDDALEAPLQGLRSVQDRLGAIQDCVAALPLLEGNTRASAAVKHLMAVREQDFRTHWLQNIADQRTLWITALENTHENLHPPPR
jgi:CHAD domain-containing protein